MKRAIYRPIRHLPGALECSPLLTADSVRDSMEKAGAVLQPYLLESVGCAAGPLCPSCLAADAAPRAMATHWADVCGRCGEPYLAFRRDLNGEGRRWYSFNPWREYRR